MIKARIGDLEKAAWVRWTLEVAVCIHPSLQPALQTLVSERVCLAGPGVVWWAYELQAGHRGPVPLLATSHY